VGEELFGCEDGGIVGIGVGVGFGGGAVSPGYAAASQHAVEHCFDVADYRVGARGGARREEPAAFVRVGEHGAFGWVEAAGLGSGQVWLDCWRKGTIALTYLADCHTTAFTSFDWHELRARTRKDIWRSLVWALRSGLDVQAFASKRCLDNTFS
jgi:hypothetical protein